MQIAQMRSQETGRVMMRSTNTGVSAFIDHKGNVIAQTEQFKTESITELVQGRSGVTPFYFFAKIQGVLAAIILIAGLFLSSSMGREFFHRREPLEKD
jgi:apolipoprotein N-acyltransferase